MSGGESGGYAPGDPANPSEMSNADNFQYLNGNYQKDLFGQYVSQLTPDKRESLRTAAVYKPTGRVYDSKSQDVTDLYNEYMSWQQKERLSTAATNDIREKIAQNPGRQQTMLVAQATGKNDILGVPAAPNSVLG